MSLVNKMQSLRTELEASQQRLAELQKENQRLELLAQHINFLDNALDGYLFTNERDDVLFINRFLLNQLGYHENEKFLVLGSSLSNTHHSDPIEWDLLRHDLTQQGSVRERKIEMRATDGSLRFFRVTGVVTYDPSGAPVGAQYTFRLLPHTNRLSTAELRAENRELAALSTIGRTALTTMDVNVVVQHLMHTVRALFAVETMWVYLSRKDHPIRLAAHMGLSSAEIPLVEAAADEFFTFLQRTDSRQPKLFGRSGPLPDEWERARQLGLRKVAITPLVAQEETLGLLLLASHSERFLIESDLLTLERVAQYAALALSNAILYHDLQGAYEELKQAQERLVDAERQKVVVEMAGAAAHELNQPLTVLLGHSNLLVRQMSADNPYRATFETIERNTRKISEIVARLGKITRYRTREYIEGQGIVDIEAASQDEE